MILNKQSNRYDLRELLILSIPWYTGNDRLVIREIKSYNGKLYIFVETQPAYSSIHYIYLISYDLITKAVDLLYQDQQPSFNDGYFSLCYTVLPNGRIILIEYNGYTNKCIFIKYTDNNGETWADATYTENLHFNNRIYRLSTGRLILLANDYNNNIGYIYSDDGGETWLEKHYHLL